MTNIVNFLSDILNLPIRYSFILYIIAGVFSLVLLDGIISFLLGSVNSVFTGGRK